MKCKNCKEDIFLSNNYCSNCGAEIVNERISTKILWENFAINFFGWDNKYFKTLKDLIVQPELVLGDYLQGVRKKYVSPFTFVAIGTALSMLVFTELTEEYLEISKSFTIQQIEVVNEQTKEKQPNQDKQKESIQESIESQRSMIKYYNLLTFLLIPLYTLGAFWVFGKPYNYGEHLIINCYLQGVTFLLTSICLLAAVYIKPQLYFLMIIGSVLYYSYGYKRIYNHNLVKTILKLLIFIGILIAVFILIIIFGFLFSKIR